VAPWAKVGGLADVLGSLPPALAGAAQHIDIRVLVPRYAQVPHALFEHAPPPLTFETSGALAPRCTVALWETQPEGWRGARLYWLDAPAVFQEPPDIYPYHRLDIEMRRSLTLADALPGVVAATGWRPHILHGHDWQAAPGLWQASQSKAAGHRVLTLHNLGHQGVWEGINWLARGIETAAWVTTVSPTYAKEIQTAEQGAGLEALLHAKAAAGQLTGILNGLDEIRFHPATDPHLLAPFTSASLVEGKAQHKRWLQSRFGYPQTSRVHNGNDDVPLVAFVGRLAPQKGVDIILDLLRSGTDTLLPVHWLIVGSGDPDLEAQLREVATGLPELQLWLGYDAQLAQRVYAGADVLAMPSRYEPCGLSQMLAMRYGTVPVVRKTGGLVDTVQDVRDVPQEGTGFCFGPATVEAFGDTLQAALQYRRQQPQAWQALQRRGMAKPWGWDGPARAYLDGYRQLFASQQEGHSSPDL
jgi:starch synthase